jgi:hypothetical protein
MKRQRDDGVFVGEGADSIPKMIRSNTAERVVFQNGKQVWGIFQWKSLYCVVETNKTKKEFNNVLQLKMMFFNERNAEKKRAMNLDRFSSIDFISSIAHHCTSFVSISRASHFHVILFNRCLLRPRN